MTNFGKGSERIRVQQGMRPVAEALKKRTGGKWQEWQLQISKHMNDQQMLVGSLTWCSCSDKGPMRDQPSGAMAQTSLLHQLKGNENLRLKGNTAEIRPSILLQVTGVRLWEAKEESNRCWIHDFPLLHECLNWCGNTFLWAGVLERELCPHHFLNSIRQFQVLS